jgi:hypothetical protein
MSCGVKGFFDVLEHRSRRHFVVEIEGHVVRWPHTLQRRAVTCTETKLASVEQASFFNVFFDYFQNDFFE